ncbi:MAG: UPF0758 domain-containing protein [Candidatus Eisenbacteria bacterium]
MAKYSGLKSSLQTSTDGTPVWHHPGGKLVELGSHALKQDELLAILIGSGVSGRPALSIANAILDQYVGLHGIHRQATIEDIARIPGLGRRKAERILAAIELGRRLHALNRSSTVAPATAGDLFSSVRDDPGSQASDNAAGDAQLLAKVIGSGVRGRSSLVIAKALLARFGSFRGLYGRDMGDFLSIKGLNSVKIIRITAALEIAKRLANAI